MRYVAAIISGGEWDSHEIFVTRDAERTQLRAQVQRRDACTGVARIRNVTLRNATRIMGVRVWVMGG